MASGVTAKQLAALKAAATIKKTAEETASGNGVTAEQIAQLRAAAPPKKTTETAETMSGAVPYQKQEIYPADFGKKINLSIGNSGVQAVQKTGKAAAETKAAEETVPYQKQEIFPADFGKKINLSIGNSGVQAVRETGKAAAAARKQATDAKKQAETLYAQADAQEKEASGLALPSIPTKSVENGGVIPAYNSRAAAVDAARIAREQPQKRAGLDAANETRKQADEFQAQYYAAIPSLFEFGKLSQRNEDTAKKDSTYDIINSRNRAEAAAMKSFSLNGTPNEDVSILGKLTDTEAGTYNYLYATEGKAAADKYLSYIRGTLNARAAGEVVKKLDDAGAAGTALKAALAVPVGVDQAVSGWRQALSGEPVPASVLQNVGGMIREQAQQDNAFVTGLWDFGVIAGNMAPSVLISTATGGLLSSAGVASAGKIAELVGDFALGTSAAGNAYGQALQDGYAPDQARTYGTLVGASEAGLQYLLGGVAKLGGIGADKIMTKIRYLDDGFARVALTGATKFVSEGSEEALQEYLEPLMRTLIFDEAYDFGENTKNAIYAGLLGGLSGLAFGMGDIADARNPYGLATVDWKAAADYFGADGVDWFAGINSEAEVEARFRELAKANHPDAGGNSETFTRIKTQRDLLKANLAGKNAVTDAEVKRAQQDTDSGRAEGTQSGVDTETKVNVNAAAETAQESVQAAGNGEAEVTADNPVDISETRQSAVTRAETVSAKPKKAYIPRKVLSIDAAQGYTVDTAMPEGDMSERAQIVYSDGYLDEDRVDYFASVQDSEGLTKQLIAYSKDGKLTDSVKDRITKQFGLLNQYINSMQGGKISDVNDSIVYRKAEPKTENAPEGLKLPTVEGVQNESELQTAENTEAGTVTGDRTDEVAGGGRGSVLPGGLSGAADESTGGSAGSVVGAAEGTGSIDEGRKASGAEQRDKAIYRSNRIKAEPGITLTSAQDLGISSGSDAKSLHVFPETTYDEEMRSVADAVYRDTGRRVRYVDNSLRLKNGRTADGVLTRDGMILNACGRKRTVSQIAGHELYHDMARRNPSLVADAKKALDWDNRDDETKRRAVEAYVERYGTMFEDQWLGKNGLDRENLSDAMREQMESYVEEHIVEEIFADAYAGADVYGANASEFSEVVREQAGKTRTESERGNQIREPDEDRYEIDEPGFKKHKYFDRLIDTIDTSRQKYITIGNIESGSAIQKVGMPSGKLFADVSKLTAELTNHSSDITKETMKQIPDLLNDPITITEYKPGQNTKTISVYGNLYTESGTPIVVGIMISKSPNGAEISKFRTIHPRKDLANQITDDSVLYLKPNKKEIDSWYQFRGIDVPLKGTERGVIRTIDLEDSITQNDSAVNREDEFSLSENTEKTDREYMDAVESGDMESADVLVKKAAKRAGYTVKAYHGTPTKGITIFDNRKIGSNTDEGIFGRGFYFTTSEKTAYLYKGTDGSVMPVYLRIKNPFWANSFNSVEKASKALDLEPSSFTVRTTGLGRVAAPRGGFESPFTSHLLYSGFDSVVVQHGNQNYEIVVFDNRLVKSADTVVYDDNGNVIPPSQRFNRENEDIRYALSDEEEAAVREKNASLRDLLKALNPPSRARESVRLEIDAALSAMITNRNVSEQAIENLWDALLDSDAVSIAPQDENYKDIADALKGTKIHVNDIVKGDLGDDWKSLKKRASKVGITLTRMPSQDVPGIDQISMELAERFPGYFEEAPDDLAEGLKLIIENAESGRDMTLTHSEYDEYLTGRGEQTEGEYRDDLRMKFDDIMEKLAEAVEAMPEVAEEIPIPENAPKEKHVPDDIEDALQNETDEAYERDFARGTEEYLGEGQQEEDSPKSLLDILRESEQKSRRGNEPWNPTEYEKARLKDLEEGRKNFDGTNDEYWDYVEKQQKEEAFERLKGQKKKDFIGSPALQKLGVLVDRSVGVYSGVKSLVEMDKAAKDIQRQVQKAENRLKATKAEKAFAKNVAAGTFEIEDAPGSMRAAVVDELADLYWAEKTAGSDLIKRQKRDIGRALDKLADMTFAKLSPDDDPLLNDKNFKTKASSLVLEHRSPERIMRSLFGQEGGEIFDIYFRPVQVNEAEKTRFMNRMYDEVRTFKDSSGKSREMTETEREVTQLVMELRGIESLVDTQPRADVIREAANRFQKTGKKTKNFGGFAIELGLSEDETEIAERFYKARKAIEDFDGKRYDMAIVDRAATKYAQKFDEFYDAINDFLVAHGFDPIPYRKGYAPHMQDDENHGILAASLQALGLNTSVMELPTSLAGKTADYKPGKRWNPYFLQRTGEKTKLDIAAGYESYVMYLSDILYHTDDIARVRSMSDYFRRKYAPQALREEIDSIYEMRDASADEKREILKRMGLLPDNAVMTDEQTEAALDAELNKLMQDERNKSAYSGLVTWLDNYANILAGKQTFADRSDEYRIGRTVLNLANNLVDTFQRSNVAGNVSSALNQTAQLPIIRAQLGEKYTRKAFTDIVSGKAGAQWQAESDFLTGKKGISYLTTGNGERFLSALFAPAEFMDHLMSTIAVRGAYLKAVDRTMNPEQAMQYADNFGRRIMGSREKGTKPTTFNAKGPIQKMLNVFQIEALNTWDNMFSDLPAEIKEIARTKGKKEGAKRLASVLVSLILGSFLTNRLAEELYGGTPAPFDVIGFSANFLASGEGLTTNQYLKTLLDNAGEKLFGERYLKTKPLSEDKEFHTASALEDLGYNISNEVPYLNNVSALLGLGDKTLPLPDIYGNTSAIASDIGSLIAEGATASEGLQLGKDIGAAALEFLPGGKQIKKTAQGAELLARGGEYSGYGDNARLKYPVSGADAAKALLFGKSSTEANKEYYASGASALSAKQTELYRSIINSGIGRNEAYEKIRSVSDLEPINGKKTVSDWQKAEVFTESGFGDDIVSAAMETYLSDEHLSDLNEAKAAGISAKDFVAIELAREGTKQEDAAAAIDKMGSRLTQEQKAAAWRIITGAKTDKNNPYADGVKGLSLPSLDDDDRNSSVPSLGFPKLELPKLELPKLP